MKNKLGISKQKDRYKIVNGALLTVYILLSSLLVYSIFRYNILAFRYMNLIVVALLATVAILASFSIIKNKGRIWTTLLLSLSIVISAASMYVVKEAQDLTKGLNATTNYSEYEMSVIVPADSDINDIKQVTEVSAPIGNDAENIQSLVDDVQNTKKVSLVVHQSNSYAGAYQSMLAGESKAMLLNSIFADTIQSEHPDYATKIKKVYTTKIRKKVETANKEQDTNADVFNVYVSGIDTYGPISSVSRSDVNIIMTVNRKTKKVLLTTTPRDAYVPIADGGNNQNDKLTHAGIYGVNASIHTLENLYGIKMNYYVRLNFTSFLKLIDSLGGIDIQNDQEFTSLHGNHHFPVGTIHLDSEQALIFVRERYSLSGGDNDRGKNQEKVIAAIIKKLTSTDALKNYQTIISGLQDSVQTDMNFETMMNLINSQLESGGSYTVASQALTGTGTMGLPSYAMPNSNLYMMEVNQDSLSASKTAIQDVMEGK